jgi:hypothetical protein
VYSPAAVSATLKAVRAFDGQDGELRWELNRLADATIAGCIEKIEGIPAFQENGIGDNSATRIVYEIDTLTSQVKLETMLPIKASSN